MVQVKISHLVGGLVALVLIIAGAFTVGTKWNAGAETHVVSASTAFEDDAAPEEGFFEGAGEERESTPLYDVVKVIDGDTITVSMNGKNETIRLIGIDTPETSDPRTGVQCFGKEATEKLKAVIGKRVSIEKDEGQGERDKYSRLLAYIYSEEGTMLNRYMLAQGYAYEYTYDDPYKYQKEFKAAEAAAKAAKRGLWAPNACPEPQKAVVPTPSEPTPQPQVQTQEVSTTQPQPTQEPVAQPKAEPTPPPPAPANVSGYTCSSNKYNCTDFKTHAEAQAVYEMCGGADNDVHKLDSNKDGEACESLP